MEGQIEFKSTTSSNPYFNNIDSDKTEKKSYFIKEKEQFSLKENTASTYVEGIKGIGDTPKNTFKINDLMKRKCLSLLDNENIDVGYTSMTEIFLKDLVEDDLYLAKEVLNRVYVEILDKPVRLQKFIEVMSNLDYEKLYPTNMTLAYGVINNVDISVQEAAIAAFEKWDDPKNIPALKSTRYTVDWIEQYANEVIDYLESC